MNKSYKEWEVRGLLLPSIDWTDGVAYSLGKELLACVIDRSSGESVEIGLSDDRSRIVSLRVNKGSGIDDRALARLPLLTLLELAQRYFRDVDLYVREDDLDLAQAIAIADRGPGEVETSRQRPSALEFATEWKRMARELKRGRRKALAARYQVTEFTIDKWTREARDRGLIPKAATGRNRFARNENTSDASASETPENGEHNGKN